VNKYLKYAPCILQKRKSISAVTANSRVGEGGLSENSSVQRKPYKATENLVSAVAAGFVLILVAVIFINTPGLWDSIISFFSNLTFATVPGTGISLPAPIAPSAHTILYGAVFQFVLGVGIMEIIVLALRLALHSPVNRVAETVGNIVFWFGTAYLVNTYLNEAATINKWFVFWAGILVFLGLSLIARGFVLLAKR
jgi:hypothetical protein